MQSHDNSNHDRRIMDSLETKARKMSEEGSNTITAGEFGEQVLFEHNEERMLIRRLQDDPDCLRVSIGEVNLSTRDSYLVFRGDPKKVKLLLTRMLNAFRQQFPE